jgi:hypothetical protein
MLSHGESIMKRQGTTIWTTSRHFAVLAGLLTSTLIGCQADDPDAEPATDVAAPALSSECVALGGLQNCALGAAIVTPSSDGLALDVAGLRTAGQDGVATFVPATRTFGMAGSTTADQRTTEISRAISQGELISTMTAQHNAAGLALTGTFSGNDDATYNANLYQGGELVGVVPALKSNTQGLQIYPGSTDFRIHVVYWGFGNYEVWIWTYLTGTQPKAAEPVAGACIWKVDLAKDSDPHVTLPDGTSVAVDHVELVENVTAAGSYPYLTFDRVDYTSNAGALHVTSETAK